MANSDLPGYAPERPLWQPPAVIPSGSVGELARAVQTALAGISGALQQLGGRRNVVPLQGDLDARDGQVIAGVASGQVITLPSPDLGQFCTITVIVTAVSSAATVVSTDGSSYALDQTGVYEFSISPDDTAWSAPPWLSSTGAGFDWATTLGKGNTTSGTSPEVSSGDALNFASGSSGITADDELTLASTGLMHLHPSGQLHLGHDGVTSEIHAAATGDIAVQTGAGAIDLSSDTGSWATTAEITLQPGTFVAIASGYLLFNGPDVLGAGDIRSGGTFTVNANGAALFRSATARTTVQSSGADVLVRASTNIQLLTESSYIWANASDSVYIYTAGNNCVQFAASGNWALGNTFDPGTSGQVITSQGSGSPPIWADVDLSSVTYAAGDGLSLASNTFSVNATAIAGAGLENDGSNNLRIAASAAGTGLSGGGGSALAVNQATSFIWTGSHQYSNTLGFTTAGRVSQTLAANANNVDMSAANVLRLVANGFSLTGMVAGFSGQLVLIVNADSSDALNISHDSASSTAANRFYCPANTIYSVPARGCVWAYYDGPSSRWMLVAAPGNG